MPKAAPKPQAEPRSQKSDNLVKDLYYGTAEKTVAESSYHRDSQVKPYNPDDLVMKSGDYSIYEDMMHDDQVHTCVSLKKDLVLASGWDIVCEGSDYEEDEEKPLDGDAENSEKKSFAEELEDEEEPEEDVDPEADAEKAAQAELEEAIKEDLEIALREDPDVPFEDSLEELLTAYEFGFSLSEKIFKKRPDGTLTLKCLKTRHPATWLIHTDKHGNIEKYVQRGAHNDIDVNPKSLIHYVNNRKFQNPYGNSDLRPAYNAWFTKRQVMRYYAMFIENAAGAKPVARYDKDAPQTAVDKIFNAIKNLQSKSAMVIPKEIEVDYLEAKSNGEAYIKGINILNMFIGRSLMIPDLLGFQGSETGGGSYSLGKDQLMVLFKHIHRRRATIERIVNQEIIKPIVYFNHGFVEKFPKFKLRPVREEDAIELAKLWIEVVKGKIYKPSEEEINHFRKLIQFPEGKVEFQEPPPVVGLPGQPPMEGKPGDPKAEAPPPKAKEVPKKEFAKRPETPGDYHKKVNFKAIETHLDRFQDRIMSDMEPVVKGIFADLVDQIEKKKIIQGQKFDRIEDLKPRRLKEVKVALKAALREAHVEAKKIAGREILKGNFRTPVADDVYLDILESETFQFIGDWSYNITKAIKIKLMAAIKDGLPMSSVLTDVEAAGIAESLTSLERYARTKFTETTNRGRLAFFNESGVVSAYQYSAILDDRTSDICDGLHGKIFKAGDEPIPPLHFNCRSVLIPITKYEEWEADDKVGRTPIDQFIEDNKGQGFSTK